MEQLMIIGRQFEQEFSREHHLCVCVCVCVIAFLLYVLLTAHWYLRSVIGCILHLIFLALLVPT